MPDLFSNGGYWGATDSVDELIAFVARSGLLGELPLCFVTSTRREVPQPNHGTYQAADFGNNADQALGSKELDRLGDWLDEFGQFFMEIIHTRMDGSTVEWKNGVKHQRGWYDGRSDSWGPTLRAHVGHVHAAATVEGIAAANAYLDQKIAAYLQAVATHIPKADPIVSALPTIGASDYTHPKAMKLWRDRLSAATGVKPTNDAGWNKATEEFRNFLKSLKGTPEPAPKIGPQMWAAVLAFSVAEKK